MLRLLFTLFLCVATAVVTAQVVVVTNLRCDYRKEPIGVENIQPRLSWELQSTNKGIMQTAYRVLVADNLMLLNKDEGNIWDSKKVHSDASIQITYTGKPLQPAKKYYWKVQVWDNKNEVSKWSSNAWWQMGLMSKADWNNAQWIAYDVLPDSSRIVPFAHGGGKKEWGKRADVLPMFRKSFHVAKPLQSATAFICGLGQFEMSINGDKTGDHFLDPGWTQYSKHAQYVSFDILPQLQQGVNTIGVQLGNGFYYIPGERYRKLTGAYGYPKMIALIVLEYTDGSTENIVTDASWKTAPAPTYFTSIYGGEDYDANREQSGWGENSFDDAGWKSVMLTQGPLQLQSQMALPLKVMERFEPVSQTRTKPGTWVFDLGQNFSGIPLIAVSGKKGDTVRIIPAELINEEGSANQKGTGGLHQYTYILKGDGVEKWQPKFTYYGFRYLQVQGATPEGITDSVNGALPVLKNIKGLHIRNAADEIGSFNCSNNLLNKTDELIRWAIKSNTVSVFTDCPHREKLGWLEQTHLMGSSVQYNFDVAALCNKVVKDMMNAQTAEGLIPEIAPEYVHFEEPFRDSPEWGSAGILLPWYMYQWYGDKKILQEAYGMMKKYITYLRKKSNSYILSQGLGDWYDIGPNRPGISQLTPLGVTATAMYYHDLDIMQQVATLLNKSFEANAFKSEAALVKKAFNEAYLKKDSAFYATGSQTANAMALYMNLVPSAYRKGVLDNLVTDIRNRNNALTAGDVGYRYVLRVLEDAGRSDVIYDMNSRDDVPGYGYMLRNGATALTESWQAYPSVSNNHFMLGHLMEWFYAGLCGIRQARGSVGYKEIEIKPQPVGDITQAKAAYHSIHGLITVEWKIEGDYFVLKTAIPSNTKAKIYFPKSYNAVPVQVGSGAHEFAIKKK